MKCDFKEIQKPVLIDVQPAKLSTEAASIPITHSQSSHEEDRNLGYKIRRTALGDNPTQEEMDAVSFLWSKTVSN
jgi:hypothetical protein